MEKQNIFVLSVCLFSGLFAVINTYEDSYSIIQNINSPFESITMDEIDSEALLREDEENSGTGVPIRFAHGFDVDYGINNSGTWEETEEIIDSSMTISKFKNLLNQSDLSIFKQRFFTVRPSHEIRYNIKSFRSTFGPIPVIREFLILGTCYLLKENK